LADKLLISAALITFVGIKELVSKVSKAKAHSYKYTDKKRWDKIGKIVKETQKIKHKHHTFLEFLEDLSIKPLTGIPLALLIMFLSIELVRFIGEGLIGYVFEPLFNLYLPYVAGLGTFLGNGIIHDILIGTLINGQIDFVQSMGLLTTGLFVPLAMVLPYVFSFYLALSFLEDSGYLPRLGVLIDNLMHRIGLHGLAIIF